MKIYEQLRDALATTFEKEVGQPGSHIRDVYTHDIETDDYGEAEVHLILNDGNSPVVIHLDEEDLVKAVSINIDEYNEGQFPWTVLQQIFPVIKQCEDVVRQEVEKLILG